MKKKEEQQLSTFYELRLAEFFSIVLPQRIVCVKLVHVFESRGEKRRKNSQISSFYVQHSDCGDVAVKSRSFLTLLASLSSSAAASVRIAILSGVVMPSVPFGVRGVRLLGPPERELGPLGVPGEPDFL